MNRYIDYDAIDYKNYNMIGESQEFMRGVVYMADRIEEAPSIDICFCRDCKKRDDDYVCYKWASVDECPQVRPDDFCSYGSRSEKPNNSTISKMEQVETMSCAECKHRPIGAEICEEPCHYEPQTDWHYDEQDATWYPYKHEDEPQQESCATCKHALGNWDGESNNCGRCCGADRRFYEPKDEPQTEPNLILPERMERGEMYEVGDSIVVMNSEDYYDLLCKSWEKDEPQTERSE